MQKLVAAWPFVAGILLCEGVGVVAAVATQQSVQTWYPTLEKPFFTPPDGLFAPVWVVLYAAMGVSAALVWSAGADRRAVHVALLVFAGQLVLNGAWSVVFFGARSIAGWLLAPYLAWVTYALALNAAVWWMN